MPITADKIKIMKSEVLLDTDDGGGLMTGAEVVDGVSNNLFPDISELDRAYGRISLRKAFSGAFTTSVDTYYGSHLIVTEKPDDPKVNVAIFTTGDWFDMRAAAQSRVEQYLAPGIKWQGHLAENQLSGARAFQMVMQMGDPLPDVGQTMYLVEDEGKSTQYSQYVRVKKVTSIIRSFTEDDGSSWNGVLATVEITDPLRYTFHGIAPTKLAFKIAASKAAVRDTIVSDSSKYYGMSHLTEPRFLGDLTVKVASIYSQLVPSAETEVPLLDLNIAGQQSPLYQAGGDVTLTFPGTTLNTGISFHAGNPILPGSLRMTLNSSPYIDDAGQLRNTATNTVVGTVNYGGGIVDFVLAGNFNLTSVTFKPAGVPIRPANSACIPIIEGNRGYVYAINMNPPPPPLGLVVSYRAQNKWYELRDTGPSGGFGVLQGSDPAFGTGSLNYTTGTCSITLGALADIDSVIMFVWGTPGNFQDRSAQTVTQPVFKVSTNEGGLIPNSVFILWPKVGGQFYIARDDGYGKWITTARICPTSDIVIESAAWGGLTTAANILTGGIRYNTGDLTIALTTIPLGGSQFTVSYQHGAKYQKQWDLYSTTGSPAELVMDLLDTAIVPNSIEVEWNTWIIDYETVSQTPAEMQIFNKRDPVHIVRDNGAGKLFTPGEPTTVWATSDVNYATGIVKWRPDVTISLPKPRYAVQEIGQLAAPVQNVFSSGGWTALDNFNFDRRGAPIYRNTFTHIEYYPAASVYDSAQGEIKIRWFSANSPSAKVENYAMSGLFFDLSDRWAEKIVEGSIRFTLGGKTYIDRLGSLYSDVNNTTGYGVQSGTVNYANGEVEVTTMAVGQTTTVELKALLTESGSEPTDYLVFKVATSPVRVGTFQIWGSRVDGTTFNVTASPTGVITATGMLGSIDYTNGLVEIRFGSLVTPNLPADLTAPWYDPAAVDVVSGKIFKPNPVFVDTLRYNAVSSTYLPLDASILGLDPVRLPPDGRVPIYRVGDVVVVHHSATLPIAVPAADLIVPAGRVRLSCVKVTDNSGAIIDNTRYTTDLDLGEITFVPGFMIGTNQTPFHLEHRVEDMALVQDVQINGVLTLTRTLTHDYPATSTKVSGALIIGDLQSRVDNAAIFSQATWTGVWQNTRIGSAPLATYNKTISPLIVTNIGSLQERWVLIFDNTTNFRVIGEHVGQIASGSISSVCAPINPAMSVPYFTINPEGWGSGWAAGYCLRFNTKAANYPVWVARTVLQGTPTVIDGDGFVIQIRGDIDNP